VTRHRHDQHAALYSAGGSNTRVSSSFNRRASSAACFCRTARIVRNSSPIRCADSRSASISADVNRRGASSVGSAVTSDVSACSRPYRACAGTQTPEKAAMRRTAPPLTTLVRFMPLNAWCLAHGLAACSATMLPCSGMRYNIDGLPIEVGQLMVSPSLGAAPTSPIAGPGLGTLSCCASAAASAAAVSSRVRASSEVQPCLAPRHGSEVGPRNFPEKFLRKVRKERQRPLN